MKKLLTLLALSFAVSAPSYANNVEAHMHNIRDLIRSCSVLPYSLRDGVKAYHTIRSHCPEVKLVEKHRAKIKLGGNTYYAQLNEVKHSDGDFYDVVIRDYISNEEFVLYNVPAYGDVLLGVLGGHIRKIPQVYVAKLF